MNGGQGEQKYSYTAYSPEQSAELGGGRHHPVEMSGQGVVSEMDGGPCGRFVAELDGANGHGRR